MADRNMTELTLRRPDDWHLHLRDGAMLRAVLPETARHFARAIVMPNLVPPVVTGADAVMPKQREGWWGCRRTYRRPPSVRFHAHFRPHFGEFSAHNVGNVVFACICMEAVL